MSRKPPRAKLRYEHFRNRIHRYNIRRIAHLDIPGGGQVEVRDGLAIVGHIAPTHGTTLIDASDLRNPRGMSHIDLGGGALHSHKARFAGDLDLVLLSSEMYNCYFLRKGFRIPDLKAEGLARDGRDLIDADLASSLRGPVERMPEMLAVAEQG